MRPGRPSREKKVARLAPAMRRRAAVRSERRLASERSRAADPGGVPVAAPRVSPSQAKTCATKPRSRAIARSSAARRLRSHQTSAPSATIGISGTKASASPTASARRRRRARSPPSSGKAARSGSRAREDESGRDRNGSGSGIEPTNRGPSRVRRSGWPRRRRTSPPRKQLDHATLGRMPKRRPGCRMPRRAAEVERGRG